MDLELAIAQCLADADTIASAEHDRDAVAALLAVTRARALRSVAEGLRAAGMDSGSLDSEAAQLDRAARVLGHSE